MFGITPRLAWIVYVEGQNKEGEYINERVIIDAITGEYINSTTNIRSNIPITKKTETVSEAEGIGSKGDTKKFTANLIVITETIYSSDGRPGPSSIISKTFQLHNKKYKIKTYEYDTAGTPGAMPGKLVENSTKIFNSTSFAAAVDAHYNLEKTYEYYLNTLGRKSYDNKGMEIISTVNYRENKAGTAVIWNNACWDGQQIRFGEGDTQRYARSVALDTVAHEYTHGVVDYTAKLEYKNVSGALNESYADILGNLIEGPPSSNWVHAETSYRPSSTKTELRSLSNPNTHNQPDEVGGKYYHNYIKNPTSDDGGVHTNSGIINHVAWEMFDGGIQRTDLAKIWYQSLLKLQKDATFFDCRSAVISSARQLKFDNSKIEVIKSAFTEAGISNELDSKIWYYEDMKAALDQGIIQGYKDGTIKPTQLMTNAEFLKVVIGAYEVTVGNSVTIGASYPISWRVHWANDELKYAHDNGWIDATLDPNAIITREEAGAYLWRAYLTEKGRIGSNLKLKEYTASDNKWKIYNWDKHKAFSDYSDIDGNYMKEMFQLYLNEIYTGIIHNEGLLLNPKQELTRATCCTIIMRTFKK